MVTDETKSFERVLASWPKWARGLAETYRSGVASVFLVYGNIYDLIPVYADEKKELQDFISLKQWLAAQLFGQRDVVIHYDKGKGLSFLDFSGKDRQKEMRADFYRTLKALDSVHGTDYSAALPRDPRTVLDILDRYITHKLVSPGAASDEKRKSLAIIIEYSETIVPETGVYELSGELGTNLLKILNWANDPAIRGADITVCLLTENLGDLNRRLVENAHTARIEVGLPDEAERLEFVQWLAAQRPNFAQMCQATPEVMAKLTSGLSRVGIMQMVDQALKNDRPFTLDYLRAKKKELIEKECFNLLEFIEPPYTLDMVVGNDNAKKRLREDAELIAEGELGSVPMGCLVCGVVGTGKTFLSECFAGSVGIPAVKLLNLRDKWQGVSEGNTQKVLSVIRALGPVAVIIDEADAALGDRRSEGDSGVSNRMFAMFSNQMADTKYRGRIFWMLLTCRPDLLPVDLKRQGRCEIHIPLFAPQSEQERKEMFLSMAKKNKAVVSAEDIPPLPDGFTGADIEGIVVRALRLSRLKKESALSRQSIEDALRDFISPDYAIEKELQQLVAIRECTSLELLPPQYQKYARDDKEKAWMTRRIEELKALIGET